MDRHNININGDDTFKDQDIRVCKAVNMILEREYPGHPWSIGVDHKAGTVVIDLLYSKPYKYRNHAYLLHLNKLASSDNVRYVTRAGGELLERFGIPREAANVDTRRRVMAGHFTLDVSNARD